MTTPASGRAQRASNGLLICIVLAVGGMAGAASFRHVHDWTMDNSPLGTPTWFGWANAVITELIPTAALIIIAQRRRTGGSIGYPMFLLIAAVTLSLTAQLAVAVPTVFGWMVSSLPSLAFFALSKLVFSATAHRAPATNPAADPAAGLEELTARLHRLETRPTPVPATLPASPARATSSSDTATGPAHPDADTMTPASTDSSPRANPVSPGPPAVTVRTSAVAPASVPAVAVKTAAQTWAQLIPAARRYADSHQHAHGEPITAGQLAARMRINTDAAKTLLGQLTDNNHPAANTAPHNGHTLQGVTA